MSCTGHWPGTAARRWPTIGATLATDIHIYFCDPRSPRQRGSNENTNGLLGRYFPRGIDLSGFSQAKLDEVARRLNERPRKTLDFKTPIERYQQAFALTG